MFRRFLPRNAAKSTWQQMIAVARVPVRFPVVEGIGIFIGVAAWDLLALGELQWLKALLAGAIGALVWYAVRRRRSSGDVASPGHRFTRPTGGPKHKE